MDDDGRPVDRDRAAGTLQNEPRVRQRDQEETVPARRIRDVAGGALRTRGARRACRPLAAGRSRSAVADVVHAPTGADGEATLGAVLIALGELRASDHRAALEP